jgi:hypothetical protein
LFINPILHLIVDIFPCIVGGVATERNAKIWAKGKECRE